MREIVAPPNQGIMANVPYPAAKETGAEPSWNIRAVEQDVCSYESVEVTGNRYSKVSGESL